MQTQDPRLSAAPAILDDAFHQFWGEAAPRIEIVSYALAAQVSPDYSGGVWYTSTFTDEGITYPLRILQGPENLKVVNPAAWFEGQMDAFSFSLGLWMMIGSHASFAYHENGDQDTAMKAARYYHALRNWIFDDDNNIVIDKTPIYLMTD